MNGRLIDEVFMKRSVLLSLSFALTSTALIAQGIVLPSPRVTWQEVTDIREVTRGGFGATGN